MTEQPEVRMTYTEWLEQKRVAQESGLEMAARIADNEANEYDKNTSSDAGYSRTADLHGMLACQSVAKAIRAARGTAQESWRESARELIAKWRNDYEDYKVQGYLECADELEAALGASATDSARCKCGHVFLAGEVFCPECASGAAAMQAAREPGPAIPLLRIHPAWRDDALEERINAVVDDAQEPAPGPASSESLRERADAIARKYFDTPSVQRDLANEIVALASAPSPVQGSDQRAGEGSAK